MALRAASNLSVTAVSLSLSLSEHGSYQYAISCESEILCFLYNFTIISNSPVLNIQT